MGNTSQGNDRAKEKGHEGYMANITKSGKHYKPSFLEKDHPGRDIGEGLKPIEPKRKKKKRKEIEL